MSIDTQKAAEILQQSLEYLNENPSLYDYTREDISGLLSETGVVSLLKRTPPTDFLAWAAENKVAAEEFFTIADVIRTPINFLSYQEELLGEQGKATQLLLQLEQLFEQSGDRLFMKDSHELRLYFDFEDLIDSSPVHPSENIVPSTKDFSQDERVTRGFATYITYENWFPLSEDAVVANTLIRDINLDDPQIAYAYFRGETASELAGVVRDHLISLGINTDEKTVSVDSGKTYDERTLIVQLSTKDYQEIYLPAAKQFFEDLNTNNPDFDDAAQPHAGYEAGKDTFEFNALSYVPTKYLSDLQHPSINEKISAIEGLSATLSFGRLEASIYGDFVDFTDEVPNSAEEYVIAGTLYFDSINEEKLFGGHLPKSITGRKEEIMEALMENAMSVIQGIRYLEQVFGEHLKIPAPANDSAPTAKPIDKKLGM